jgi:hypothetical protein
MLRDERRGPVPQPERGRLAGVALTDLTLLEDAFGRLEPPRQVQPADAVYRLSAWSRTDRARCASRRRWNVPPACVTFHPIAASSS